MLYITQIKLSLKTHVCIASRKHDVAILPKSLIDKNFINKLCHY